ncbi:MAG: diguanylate cyclase [Schwartzia sp.]|nr:diguanylate cyclase [Schwartzia sp. (in: firmicutes)]
MPKKQTILSILPAGPMTAEFSDKLAAGFELIRVEDETTGLRILDAAHERISAVLLDFDTAKASDFTFLREVNANVLYAAIPVIIAVPRPLTHEDMACLSLGAADILTPPCEGALLAKRISNVIRAKDSATFHEIERMLKMLPSNIYLKDAEGKYIFATHYWHHLDKSGDPNWTIRGKTDPEIRKDKENAILAYESDKKILATGVGTRYIIEINVDNQHEFLELIKEPVRDDSGKITGIIAIINNVTEQQLLKLEFEKRSKTDELTGLYNRRCYEESIQQIHARDTFPVSLIFADCNGLKYINDTYGHLMGDEYIRMSALLFRMVLPKDALVFRVGGDEFAMILPGIGREEAQTMIDEMMEKTALFRIRDQQLSLAFGLSTIESPMDSLKNCIDEADKKMYENKRKSKQARS